jgi:hypothetical protein
MGHERNGRAVIARIPLLWGTAVISHPGTAKAGVGNVNARLRSSAKGQALKYQNFRLLA